MTRLRLVRLLLVAFAMPLVPLQTQALLAADESSARLEISQSVSQSTVQVAEPLDFTITVLAPEAVVVDFPSETDTFGELQVVAQKDFPDMPVADSDSRPRRKWRRKWMLESLRSGKYEIPGITIAVRPNPDLDSNLTETVPSTISSEPVTINVVSVLENSAKLSEYRDIASILDAPQPKASSSWQPIAIALTVAGVVGLLTLVWRMHSQRRLDSMQWTRKSLGQLKVELQQERKSPFEGMESLDRIMRDVITEQTGRVASMLSTSELTQLIRPAGKDASDLLPEIFVHAERAKFSPVGESEVQREQVLKFIDDAQDCLESLSEITGADNQAPTTSDHSEAA